MSRRRALSCLLLLALTAALGAPAARAAESKARPHERVERVERDRAKDRAVEHGRRPGEAAAERRTTESDRRFLERIDKMSAETRGKVEQLRERGDYQIVNDRPGFESQASFEYHHAKHVLEAKEYGRELSPREYLEQAQRMRDRRADGQTLIEGVRVRDGLKTRFDRATGEWACYNADGTIRTQFKPNNGEAYFHADLDPLAARR
ncbi:MAG: hypothetical protein GC160_11805 [Acidobacteria bacterium]|nr:hypothetical protein [Acidobacteriota bacterium]